MKKTGLNVINKCLLFTTALFTHFFAHAQETINSISIINDNSNSSSLPLWIWIIIVVALLAGVAAIITHQQDDFRIIMKADNSRKKTKNR